MNGHWFVVASQNTVKIFTEVATRKKIDLIQQFENPLGRERVSELIKKQVGRGVRSVGRGVVHFAEKKRSNPHEIAANKFAKTVARFLESELQNKNFTSITIFAEPHFLGKLRSAMKPSVISRVQSWIKKDLLNTPKKGLTQILVPQKNQVNLVLQ